MDDKPKRKAKMIPVRVLKQKVDTSMVEFVNGGLLQRVSIPTAELNESKVAEAVLDLGIPYGVAWEDVKLLADAKRLANALRKNGIWTCEDMQSNPNIVIASIKEAIGLDLASLMEFARKNK